MSQQTSIRNGEALADRFLSLSQENSVGQLLTDLFNVPEPTALVIERSFRRADVSVCPLGSLAMEGIPPKKVDRKLSSLQDAYTLPSGQISIHPVMVNAVEEYLLHDSLLGLTPAVSKRAATRISAAYEVGRYLGYGIWHLVTERSAVLNEKEDLNINEATAFLDRVWNLFTERGVTDVQSNGDHDPGLITCYTTSVLPERFFSRAGLMVLEKINTVITGNKVWGRVREHFLDQYLGELHADADKSRPAHDEPTEIEIPPLEELGVLYPLSDQEFQNYWPSSQPTKVIDLRYFRDQR